MDWSYVITAIVGGFLAWLGYKPIELAVEYLRAEGVSLRRKGTRLQGRWFAAWETTVEGKEVLNTEELELKQRGLRIKVRNLTVSPENPRGGYLWRGELRVHQREYFTGWYESVDPKVFARGSLYFHLNAAGKFLQGWWAGCSYDSPTARGAAVIAETREFAMQKLRETCKAAKLSQPSRKGRHND